MSADGKVLAETVVDAAGNETRKYPYGNMYAHVVGFSTNGKSGIESNMNFNLLRSHSFVLERMFNEIKDEKSMGDNSISVLFLIAAVGGFVNLLINGRKLPSIT